MQRVTPTHYNKTPMKQTKIIKVKLHIQHDGVSEYYFSSLKSIFNTLGAEIVGISYSALVNTHFTTNGFYANKYCVITLENLN